MTKTLTTKKYMQREVKNITSVILSDIDRVKLDIHFDTESEITSYRNEIKKFIALRQLEDYQS